MNILDFCKKDKDARKNLIQCIKNLVHNGEKSFTDLCEGEQREVVGHLISALDDKSEWLVESNDVDITLSKLIKVMACSTCEDIKNSREEFIEAVQNQAVSYFSQSLDEIMHILTEKNYVLS
jgi:hypothetical protein